MLTSNGMPEVARKLVAEDGVGIRRGLLAVGNIPGGVVDVSGDKIGVAGELTVDGSAEDTTGVAVASTEGEARTGEELDVLATTEDNGEGELAAIDDST